MLKKEINYNKHLITNSDIQNVIRALKSDRITQGKFVNIFEKKISAFFGSKYTLAVSNATSAFLLLSQLLNWKKNDHIILSPITFVSGANAVLKAGATPVFADINIADQNLDPLYVEKEIIRLKKNKKKVVAIIVTDYAGKPANWKLFKKIKEKYKLILINDNCHALGATYFGTSKYAIKFADYVVQSYHAVKNITTGEGGSILTNIKKSYKDLKALREHGFLNNDKKNPFKYNIKTPGFNFRISDINCALGISQIKRIKEIANKRGKLAKIYDKCFSKNTNIIVPLREKNINSAYHLYNVRIKFKNLNINKVEFYKKIKKKYKINLQIHYTPTYRFSVFKNYIINKNNFKNTELYFKETFSLPLYLQLKRSEILSIGRDIKKLIKVYSKNNSE